MVAATNAGRTLRRPKVIDVPQRVVAKTLVSLPQVRRAERKGSVLHPGPYSEHGDVMGLNLAAGCAHRCAFCSARAYPSYPGDDVIQLFTNTADSLDSELGRMRQRPRAVVVSPSTDPFMPLAEVQAETARIVAVLAKHDVQAWLTTRGAIRPSVMSVLARHHDLVRVIIGLTTLNRDLRRALEPLAAPVRTRLRQIAELKSLGVSVQVALEPLIPGLTDTRANLADLLRGLAAVGIDQVTASYLFLRPGIQTNLTEALKPFGGVGLLEEYAHGPMLTDTGLAPARYLPKARRQRGYASLMALASEFGIGVAVSRLTNPDFRPAVPPADKPRQRLLPLMLMRDSLS
jgi:DNA repair photolyase